MVEFGRKTNMNSCEPRIGFPRHFRYAAINVGAFSAQPFSFSFRGDFQTLGEFFSRIDQFVTLKDDGLFRELA